jgi:hypothetical protein
LTVENPKATLIIGFKNGMPGHPWNNPLPDEFYNMATQIMGMAFVGDYLVFGGTHGYGPGCYGPGTWDPTLVGTTPSFGGEPYCYDPTNSYKGCHAYPYRIQLWVFTKAQVKAVLDGVVAPDAVLPEIVVLDVPFAMESHRSVGLSYDSVKKHLWVGAYAADGYSLEPGPVFSVYEFLDGVVETPPPIVIPPTPEPTPTPGPEPTPVPVDPCLSVKVALIASQEEVALLKSQLAAANAALVYVKAAVDVIYKRLLKLKGIQGWLLEALRVIVTT